MTHNIMEASLTKFSTIAFVIMTLSILIFNMTLSIMTYCIKILFSTALSITTLSTVTFRIMTLSITAFGIRKLRKQTGKLTEWCLPIKLVPHRLPLPFF